ncbi:MAG: hypothetical protein NTW50_05225 [Candidatus Berkelbacteria bacterium]|nr:hypothetical protein [Candidatus Berkelbacteria bacterium]
MLNCLTILEDIAQLADMARDFDDSPKTMSKIRPIKERIDLKLTEVLEQISPGSLFIESILSDTNLFHFREILHEAMNFSSSLNEFLVYIIDHYRKRYLSPFLKGERSSVKLKSESYGKFLDRLIRNPEIHENLKMIITEISIFHSGRSENSLVNQIGIRELLAALNSCFLEEFLGEDQTLDIRNYSVPMGLFIFFGVGLSHGKIISRKLGRGAGNYLRGGELWVDEVEEWAGEGVMGGKISVGKAGDCFAARIKGGVAVAERSGDSPGVEGKGGVVVVHHGGDKLGSRATNGAYIGEEAKDIAKGSISSLATFLAGEEADINIHYKTNHSYSVAKFRGIATYISTSSHYFNGTGGTANVITNNDQLTNFLESGVGFNTIPSHVPKLYNHVEAMKGGILVLKRIPDHDIGEGMTGGAIIIDDPKVSIDEVRPKISKTKSGGLILLRIWDKTDLDKSRLVDVEGEQ